MGQKLYKFKAETYDAAYQRMRRQLGKDAVVLNTAEVSEGGVLGFKARKMVELTAAAPAAGGPAPRKLTALERKYAISKPVPEPVAYYEQLVRDAQERIGPPPRRARAHGGSKVVPFRAPRPHAADAAEVMNRNVKEVRDLLHVLLAETAGAGPHAAYTPHYRALLEEGVSRRLAAALVAEAAKGGDPEALRNPQVFRERLKIQVQGMVNVTGGLTLTPGIRRTVALVGATGVGKTTNLAKLAADYAVRERVRVALVTCDTYRVAAPEQLRVYANILGLPMKIVNDAQEMGAAMQEFRQYDLILIDTAGGSQFNLTQLQELKTILAVARPDEVLLLLSANTQPHELHNTVASFRCVNPTSLFFTKLDETRQYGALFSLYTEAALPLSYFSIGQNVPDDVEVVTPGKVANRMVRGPECHDRSSAEPA